jgi:hypothetical protein
VSPIFLDKLLSGVGCIGSDLDGKLRIHHLDNYITLIRTSSIKYDVLIRNLSCAHGAHVHILNLDCSMLIQRCLIFFTDEPSHLLYDIARKVG